MPDYSNINNFDEQTWERVFQESPVGIAFISKDGYWIKVNEKVQQILGYTESELLHLTYKDVTLPADVKPDTDMMNKLALGKIKSYEMIKRFITKNQYIVPVRMNMAVKRDDKTNEILFYIKHMQPILNGEKLKYENQMRADGGTTLNVRPTATIFEILRDNWKAVIPAFIAVVGFIIGLAVNYELLKYKVNSIEETLIKIEKKLDD